MKRLSFEEAYQLLYKKYGSKVGMFSRLRTKTGNPVRGKYYSYGLDKVFTKEQLLNL